MIDIKVCKRDTKNQIKKKKKKRNHTHVNLLSLDQDIPNLILSLLNSQIERKDTNCAGHLLVALGQEPCGRLLKTLCVGVNSYSIMIRILFL